MSWVIIDTSRLDGAKEYAFKAQTELNQYANELNKNIINSIKGYDGERTSNTFNAQDRIQQKINKLRAKANAYGSYGNEISIFRDEVIRQENRLVNRIKSLFGNFRDDYNLADPGFVDWILSGFEGLNDVVALIRNIKQSIRERIKNWYRYGGGREIIEAGAAILLAIAAIAVAVATALSGGAFMFLIGTILALIAAANAAVTFYFAVEAIDAASKGITHMATRNLYHADESCADRLRRDGLDAWANIIDFAEVACSIITFVQGLSKLVTGFKSALALNDGSISSLFKSIFTNIKDNIKNPLDFVKNLWNRGEMKDKVKMIETGLDFLDGINSAIGKGDFGSIVENGTKFFLEMGDISYTNSKGETKYTGLSKVISSIEKAIKTGTKTFDFTQNIKINIPKPSTLIGTGKLAGLTINSLFKGNFSAGGGMGGRGGIGGFNFAFAGGGGGGGRGLIGGR